MTSLDIGIGAILIILAAMFIEWLVSGPVIDWHHENRDEMKDEDHG